MELTLKKSLGEFGIKLGGCDKNGKINWQWMHEKIDAGRWLNGASYQDGVFSFWTAEKIGDKKINGIAVEDEGQRKEIDSYVALKIAEWNAGREKLIAEIVAGTRPLEISIVGCDYPHYQPWVEGIQFEEQPIMTEAVARILRGYGIPMPSGIGICDFLGRLIGATPRPADKLPTGATDVTTGTWEGYSAEWALSWHIRLRDVLVAWAECQRQKTQRATEKREAVFAEAKKTGQPVLLESWSEDCNDPRESCNLDNVCVYAMPDGTKKQERTHTW